MCRDHTGAILFAWTDHYPTHNPLVAEMKVALYACHVARSLSNPKLIFEGDSFIVCKAILEANYLSEGIIADDAALIRTVLAPHSQWHWSWISHNQNQMAHPLAQWAAKNSTIGSVPVSAIPFYVCNIDWVLNPLETFF